VRRWTFTGALPTRDTAWVYGLNWAAAEDGTFIVHLLGAPLVLRVYDTLVRAADGTYSIERGRPPVALPDPR
jgi:hypothetical protein